MGGGDKARITIGGKTVEGIVECPSLDYQGGQGSVPSMGGKFLLKPGYRVVMNPHCRSTPIATAGFASSSQTRAACSHAASPSTAASPAPA